MLTLVYTSNFFPIYWPTLCCAISQCKNWPCKHPCKIYWQGQFVATIVLVELGLGTILLIVSHNFEPAANRQPLQPTAGTLDVTVHQSSSWDWRESIESHSVSKHITLLNAYNLAAQRDITQPTGAQVARVNRSLLIFVCLTCRLDLHKYQITIIKGTN